MMVNWRKLISLYLSIFVCPSAMEHRPTVDAIISELLDWIYKIQVAEKFHPRDSKDHTVHL